MERALEKDASHPMDLRLLGLTPNKGLATSNAST